MWVYRTTDYVDKRAVWFDFCKGRGGEHPRRVLKDYAGTMVTDAWDRELGVGPKRPGG